MKRLGMSLLALCALPLAAGAEDAEGCKDHPLFNRLPGYSISSCQSSQFDLRRFPRGAIREDRDGNQVAESVEVEGPVVHLVYYIDEGRQKASPLQIMRNFENAAKRGGGTVEGTYPGWCPGMLDESMGVGNGCMHHGVSMRFDKGGAEYRAYAQASEEGEGYELLVVQRQAMAQDIAVNELLDQMNRDGFVTLEVHFDTGKATIKPESVALVDAAAEMLRSADTLRVEVGGHTDNVGDAEANLKLSTARAQSVMQALVARGVAAERLSAKGYGQTAPVADNRTEVGRAKNRRVELTKR
jgi:OmpA-OmpF porin, OOP family